MLSNKAVTPATQSHCTKSASPRPPSACCLQASYMVLNQGVSPVTFSVGNTMKRVAVVVSNQCSEGKLFVVKRHQTLPCLCDGRAAGGSGRDDHSSGEASSARQSCVVS